MHPDLYPRASPSLCSSQDEPLPPVVSIAMGTLGFLTPFESAEALATLERVLAADHAPVFCTLRTRRRCEVVWCARGATQPPYPTLLQRESVRDAAVVQACMLLQ